MIVVYLGDNVKSFKFKCPRACHYARFMAKAIYSTKLALLANFHEIDIQMKKSIKKQLSFAIFYWPWFMKSAVLQKAPGNNCAIIEQIKLNEKPGT